MSFFTQLRHRMWRPGLSPLERNIRLLYLELLWAAILGGITTFNAAFAVRLGASEWWVSLLSSMPPLVVALVSMPAARFLERHADRRPYILWSLMLIRLGYLVVALIPSLFLSHETAAACLILWLIVLNVPGAVFNAGWLPLMADILPERRRAFVFSRRNIINAVVVAAVTFVAGRWLSVTAFPVNYQLLYALGVVAAMLSSITLEYLIIPPNEVVAERRERGRHIAFPTISLKTVRERILNNRAFVSMTLNTLVFYFAVWMAGPLFILYFVRELGADDSWIGANTAISSLTTVVGYFVWERVIRRKGFYWVLLRVMPLSPLYPFMVSLFPNLTLILLAGAIIGFINGGIDLSHFNVLLKLCPRERRASYLGFFTTVMNVAAFIAPLVAISLANQIGLRTTLFITACMRLGGGILFHVIKFEEPPEEVWPPPASAPAPGDEAA